MFWGLLPSSEKRLRKPPLFRPAVSAHCSVPWVLRTVPSRGCRAPGPLPCSGKRKRKPPLFRPAGAAHCSVPAPFHTPYAGLGALQFLLGSCLGGFYLLARSAYGNPPCSVPRVLRTVPSRGLCTLFRPAGSAHTVPSRLPSILLKLAQELCSFCLDLVLQFFQRSCQGGATGPGLKSRSCRTASGTGGLVSRPLDSPDP